MGETMSEQMSPEELAAYLNQMDGGKGWWLEHLKV